MRLPVGVIAAACAAAGVVAPALAERHDDPHFHGNIERFHEHDWGLWRGGHWAHSRHEGRYGWWWVAGGLWYFYPAPVYPYPNPYEPPVAVIVPPADTTPAAPPPPQNWYYCAAKRNYYPYVATCPGGWKVVPAQPAAPAAPAAPPSQ